MLFNDLEKKYPQLSLKLQIYLSAIKMFNSQPFSSERDSLMSQTKLISA